MIERTPILNAVTHVILLSGVVLAVLPLLLRGRLAQSLMPGVALVLVDLGNTVYLSIVWGP